MKTPTKLSICTAALAAMLTFAAQAQSPNSPSKDQPNQGTQPAKDGSGAQKQTPAQPGDRDSALQPGKAPANHAAQPGAGSDKPAPAPQSPEQKPQQGGK